MLLWCKQEVCSGDAAIRTCTVSGLEPYTEYTFQVQACTASGCGRSSAASVRTNPAVPENMRLPSIAVINSSAVAVSWAPPAVPNGPITSYQLWVAGYFRAPPSEKHGCCVYVRVRVYVSIRTVPLSLSPSLDLFRSFFLADV